MDLLRIHFARGGAHEERKDVVIPETVEIEERLYYNSNWKRFVARGADKWIRERSLLFLIAVPLCGMRK
jgi:hypothetical protein